MPNAPKIREKICEFCGESFLAPKNRARFCSKNCVYASRVKDPTLLFQYGREINGGRLREALIHVGVPYICSECGQEPFWNGKPLTLEVDHIDGDRIDCRQHNLRFLCGHCHSQTDTFRAKNRGRKPAKIFVEPAVATLTALPASVKLDE